ncbi:MAG: NFACT family protein, partial [Defluviitaleaceae bacterium]|nr:NFACT family protein [Defluviitaleaceae bacterium]
HTLEEIEDREKLQLYGELVTANIHQIKQGNKSVTLTNYYDSTQIEIPLDSKKTPSENAQNYFKQYAKQKRQYTSILEQQKENKEQLAYLESVLNTLLTTLNEAEIEEVREELEEEKIIKRRKRIRVNSKSTYLKFQTEDGFTILIGKNNKQNDELTKNAASNDIWLHTKDIPGSHVIIKTENKKVSEATIEYAASLAALYSKEKNSSLVAVDYCLKKYVKKPNGAKLGMVIYTDFKTVFVKPMKEN